MAEKFASNIIRMKSLIGCLSFLSRSLSLFLLICSCSALLLNAQSYSQQLSLSPQSASYDTVSQTEAENFPEPKKVMYRSMMIPGWGQLTNRQAWKIPLVYGLLGGLTYYSIDLTKRYHDYRAAYYNLNEQTPDDQKFGSTPAYLADITNLENLRTNRNAFRNRRDFVYIAIGLAYGLNIIDAYVFAHMRTFDVSEDLSMKASVGPSVLRTGDPGITLSFDIFKKKD